MMCAGRIGLGRSHVPKICKSASNGWSVDDYIRRKFRSQTYDNMEKWKSEMGRIREEQRRRKNIKEEKVRRKKVQVRRKVGKSHNIVFLPWFAAHERPVGSLKRRVRSHLARWDMNSCRPLWHEAHLEVKMHKTTRFRPLLEVEMSKKKHISKSKV